MVRNDYSVNIQLPKREADSQEDGDGEEDAEAAKVETRHLLIFSFLLLPFSPSILSSPYFSPLLLSSPSHLSFSPLLLFSLSFSSLLLLYPSLLSSTLPLLSF